jgi:predicted DNA-binding ribbon-helix-helix protein
MTNSRLINRNIIANSGRTSMRLEPELWNVLNEICRREKQDMGQLIARVETAAPPGGRTSAVRVYIMKYYYAASTETGHAGAGHGVLSSLPAESMRSAA